jgi:hypothetical protein
MNAPESGVTVRLYNPGFGDCMLLAFRGIDGHPRYVLIDCGVHHSYTGGEEQAALVAEDIGRASGGHLHLVVATHEHTDHLYGFKHGRVHFDAIEIDDLWLAWTEDPTDEVAKALEDRYRRRVRALAAVVHQLGSKDRLSNAIQRVLAFEPPEALAADGGKSAQLAYLRGRSKTKLERPENYRRPGEPPLTLPGVEGVRIYVLGPPRSLEWMKKLTKESEMYPELAAMEESDAFAAAAMAASGAETLDGEERRRFWGTRPFESSYVIPADAARAHPEYGRFFRNGYGFSNRRGHGPAWRRIETDWLAAGEQLALDINNKINNTSLVLAIELADTPPGKVLLFAADAQVGNWLSWHELSWPGAEPDDTPITAEDLLRRTVLYKVGHHGSRNATMRAHGLELMDSPDLVAVLPVDEDWARGTQKWEHPAEKLLTRLRQRTRGRVLRSDAIPAGNEPPSRPAEATESEWQAFLARVDWDRGPHKLWIEYTVPA